METENNVTPSTKHDELDRIVALLRNNLRFLLLVVALILAVFSSGSERALYIVAASVLAVDIFRLTDVMRRLGLVENTLTSQGHRLDTEVTRLDGRCSQMNQEITGLSRAVTDLTTRIQTERMRTPLIPRFVTVAFVAVIGIGLINGFMFVVTRNHISSYGDRIADFLQRFDSVQSAAAQALQQSNEAMSSANKTLNTLDEKAKSIQNKCVSACGGLAEKSGDRTWNEKPVLAEKPAQNEKNNFHSPANEQAIVVAPSPIRAFSSGNVPSSTRAISAPIPPVLTPPTSIQGSSSSQSLIHIESVRVSRTTPRAEATVTSRQTPITFVVRGNISSPGFQSGTTGFSSSISHGESSSSGLTKPN